MERFKSVLAPFGAAVVSGGSSGIGRTFIADIGKANPGIRVCNLSRSKPGEFSGDFTPRHIPCDLADPGQRERAAAEVEQFIRDDSNRSKVLLINNAGIGSYGNFPSGPPGREAGIVEVNIAAVVDLTARLMPLLLERGGAIVNIASTAAFQATPFAATYGASKAFILNWSLALREELRPRGIPVIAVCPGPVRTPFFTRAGLDGTQAAGAMGIEADLVVRRTFEGLAKGRGIVVPGWRNRVLGAVASAVPRTLAARVSGMLLARERRPRGDPAS